jgi:CBS domain-containing protein
VPIERRQLEKLVANSLDSISSSTDSVNPITCGGDMITLSLEAKTAEELMTPNPVSISEHAAIIDVASVLSNREFSALAVINDAGRPVGVISRTDIVRREAKPSMTTDVREIMTATVVSVRPEDPAWEVIAKMVAFKLHRLFVVDKTGVLIGVISTFDIVRKLRGIQ